MDSTCLHLGARYQERFLISIEFLFQPELLTLSFYLFFPFSYYITLFCLYHLCLHHVFLEHTMTLRRKLFVSLYTKWNNNRVEINSPRLGVSWSGRLPRRA